MVEETLIHGRAYTDQHDVGSKECPPLLQAGQHPPALCLAPQGSGQARARPGTVGVTPGRWPQPSAGVTFRGGHTLHCHSTRRPRTPPAPGSGAGNYPGRGTATAPLRAPGKGHAAPTASPRQVEGGRRQQPAGFSRGRGFFPQEQSPPCP